MLMQSEVRTLIARPWQFGNLWRDFKVLMDGVPVARLANGRSVMIPMSPGKHEIVATIDWCRSRPLRIMVRDGSEPCLRVRCTVPWWAILFPLLIFVYGFVPGWYLEVQEVSDV